MLTVTHRDADKLDHAKIVAPIVLPDSLAIPLTFRLSLVLSLALAALAGCGTFSNAASPSRLKTEALSAPANGVVILSAGAPDSCIAQSRYLNLYDAYNRAQVTTVPAIFIDNPNVKSDFTDHYGVVGAYALPTGDYYLTPVIANPMVRPVATPEFKFHVTAGETTYIGEVYMTTACTLHNEYVVRDRFDRDVAMALAANAQLGARQPVKRLMRSGG